LLYAYGAGVPKDDKIAVKWWKLSAEQGDSRAQFNLGQMYRDGRGVTKDHKTAMKWYLLAVEDDGNYANLWHSGLIGGASLGINQQKAGSSSSSAKNATNANMESLSSQDNQQGISEKLQAPDLAAAQKSVEVTIKETQKTGKEYCLYIVIRNHKQHYVRLHVLSSQVLKDADGAKASYNLANRMNPALDGNIDIPKGEVASGWSCWTMPSTDFQPDTFILKEGPSQENPFAGSHRYATIKLKDAGSSTSSTQKSHQRKGQVVPQDEQSNSFSKFEKIIKRKSMQCYSDTLNWNFSTDGVNLYWNNILQPGNSVDSVEKKPGENTFILKTLVSETYINFKRVVAINRIIGLGVKLSEEWGVPANDTKMRCLKR